MAEFQIPKIFEKGFAELAKMDVDDFNKIVNFTKEIKLGTGPKSFQDSFAKEFPKREKVLAAAIYSFGSLLLRNNKTAYQNLANDLAESYKNVDKDADTTLLSNRLLVLLEKGESLKYTAKALDLLGENDHVYIGSRVISDIRPIFNDDLSGEKRKAAIIHNLKLEYQHNKQAKEFYISLDHADLEKLKEIIDRALEKEKLLKKGSDNSFTFITINE